MLKEILIISNKENIRGAEKMRLTHTNKDGGDQTNLPDCRQSNGLLVRVTDLGVGVALHPKKDIPWSYDFDPRNANS